jgi:glycosyltransferase involved in cell wall biosynthesis
MDIAIVAPCPIPYVIGGAENLWRGLQDHLNEHTPHQAEIIKLPTPELEFWDLLDSYRRFADLDLSGFDLVVSSKYPAWMVRHPRHVIYLQHKLRGLYDTYDLANLPLRYPDPPPAAIELQAFMDENAGRRAALPELFERVGALRRAPGVRDDLFAFPGPFIRELVHFLDGIGLAPEAIHRYGAISQTVRDRPDYFPPGHDVFVAHHPTGLQGLRRGFGRYLLTASRLDNSKRVELLVRAMAHVERDVELRIVGTGPSEAALRELAAADPRIRFCGRVPSAQLARLYAGARAVAFLPYFEDYGLVTLEAMLCAKPVITCTDSGGTTELVTDGKTGLVAEPRPEALAEAIDRVWGDRRAARRMGRAARRRARAITWDALVRELEAA